MSCATLSGRHALLATRLLRVVAVCLLLSLVACDKETRAPLRIATNNWPGYWPLYLAEAEGHLEARLQELSSATEVLRAFRNHNVEVAAFTLEEFLQLIDEGNKPRIVMVIDYSSGADSVVARPPIASVAELRGHVVGAESTAMGAYVLHRALASAGLHDEDVKIVAYDFGDHESAYEHGLVDAIVTFEPIRTRLLAEGAHEVFNSAAMPGEIADVLVVDPETERERGPELRKLIETWYAAAASMQADSKQAAKRLEHLTRLTAPQFEQAMQGIHLVTRDENARLLRGDLSTALARLATFMRDANMLHRQFTLDEVTSHISAWGTP
jgi:NitT/TauT family transport system substrate-binding protein